MTQNTNNYRYFAIIDLGSAAIRFELYKLALNSESPQLTLIEKKRTLLRLGQLKNGILPDAKIQELLNLLKEIKLIISKYNEVEVEFVATEALRKAHNRDQVINSCSQVIEKRIEIISPKKEAALTVEGILCFESFPYSKLYFLDIGGNSSEISLVNNHTIEWSVSIPYGALMQESPESGTNSPIHIPPEVREIISEIEITNPDLPLIGSGGTFRSFNKILPKLGIGSSDSSNNYKEAFCLLEKASASDFLELTKDQAERRDLLPQGLGILREILFSIDPSQIIVTKFSLRHGLLKKLILPYCPEIAETGFQGWKVELNQTE